jgi:hypothetical protein
MNRVFVMIGIGLLGCSNGGGNAPPGPSPFKPGIVLAGSIQALLAGMSTTSFNFARQDVLWVRVNVPQMDRVTTVKLQVVSPRGNLFYEATVPFSADANITTTNLPGIDHPVQVHPALAAQGGYHLDYSIAIAGSSFTRFPEPGQWQVIAEVAGQTFTSTMDVTVSL